MGNEEFKKNEGLAKKVMDILISDYINKFSMFDINPNYNNTLDIIKWSLEDYETCGYNMHQFRTYYEILKKQKDLKENRLKKRN
jgi:hypothetical protein